MIQLDHVSKLFRTENVETAALQNVSLTINKGEFTAVMGPSGCGKSTLLHILGLLDNPSQGQYRLMGSDVSQMSEWDRTEFRKGRIGFVFQNFNLIEEFNVYENIELPLIYLKMKSAERRRRVNQMMEQMHISHRAQHFPKQLSGGQQQRVAVARALVLDPQLILADEPTGNLDSRNSKEVMELFTQLHREGRTLVMVTHSAQDASYAGRVIHLLDGAVVEVP